jgi:hypothetical protein
VLDFAQLEECPMKRASDYVIRVVRLFAPALLTAWVLLPAPAQQGQAYHIGIVSDWTDRHVIFSDPGTLTDAMMHGRRQEWERIVNDPRYRMQQIKRHAPWAGQAGIPEISFPREGHPVFPIFRKSILHADWSVTLGSSIHGVAIAKYPAKYTFAPIGTPNCTADFVVFPINAAPLTNQANLLGVNNLYSGTCTTGTVPTVIFAYRVGTGPVQTSPVLSLDGTKVAFVESVTNASVFHVLKLGTNGNSGCPNATPCNGNVFNAAAVPGTLNNAVDTKLTMSGGVTDSNSGPFVDYDHDVAYVGDDTGKLHKFNGVFNGTPAEAGSPWPVTTFAGTVLTAPVFDGGTSQRVFVGGSDGRLYCFTSAGAACSPNVNILVGSGGIVDAPIVDSTQETVFATAGNGTNAILAQAPTSLASQVNVTMGVSGTDLYDGAFDSAYFTSVSTGHMYFCGNAIATATPTLWRVGFNSSGIINSARDSGSFQLVQTGQTGTTNDCTPLTEVLNGSTDFLFVGVKGHGAPSNCNGTTCMMSFSLPTASPFTFPAAPAVATTIGGSLGTGGMSGFIIDNVSTATGASQIYFGNLQANTGVQVSQSALQ